MKEDKSIKEISNWLLRMGLEGTPQDQILDGYCNRLVLAGIPVQRVHVAQRAYHPQFGGIGFDWVRDREVIREAYARGQTPLARWVQSPLYHLMSQDRVDMRERLTDAPRPHRFPFLDELRDRGATDYYAMKLAFAKLPEHLGVDPDNPPEGFVISWTSDADNGFSEANLQIFRELQMVLGLALKSASNRQMASDLLSTYMGADAGERVLSGDIQRGSVEKTHAVIWYFDLRGFTQLSEREEGAKVIGMLNAYFGEVVDVVEAQGGNVLKFMGDGLLAIFNADTDAEFEAVNRAIEGAFEVDDRLKTLSKVRKAQDEPVTDYTLALHLGDVLYGNIGGAARLDFTVIGAAVNATARMLGMCGPTGQKIILSAAVAHGVNERNSQVISLGRYMLRGMAKPQELFTLYLAEDE
ncbi:adenylate/guanylate cyclase domain-containing protein [Sulfitobacter sp. MF3-043]|uniref:adenylate/guanylate cyclase domain-containing protein n=1 Tax=Sulfitobacter sediminivivens TaxID=3252902 RepID=UPI0036DA75DB